MVDTRTPEQRRRIMKAVRSRDTKPEFFVRRLLHKLGYRFRVNVRSLPGSPDIVFSSRRKVLFVHGCFWHGHGCKIGQLPKSRLDYWRPKIEKNRQRDESVISAIECLGWEALAIWQCETTMDANLLNRLIVFLGPAKIDRH